jgi:trehalose utilization protein
LLECIVQAAPSVLHAEYARRVLRGVLWDLDLPGWEAHPTRRRADVWRALNTAIRWCSRRAGGWSVSGRLRVAVAKVPASRQWLEWLPRVAS